MFPDQIAAIKMEIFRNIPNKNFLKSKRIGNKKKYLLSSMNAQVVNIGGLHLK